MDRINGYLNQDPRRYRKMRVAGRLAAEVLEMIEPYVNRASAPASWIASVMITLLMNTRGFCLPRLSRLSEIRLHLYNEVVCHGIPDDAKLLKDGDTLTLMSP